MKFYQSLCCAVFLASCFFSVATNASNGQLSLLDVKESLSTFARKNEFPSHLNLRKQGQVSVKYTFDIELHNYIASIYRSYKPDYAAFVAIDPDTGEILSLTSYVKDSFYEPNFALGSSYPAASLFKIVSAAAGLDSGVVNSKTVLPFNGKSTTLYKKQIFNHKDNKYTRKVPFKVAFAKSSNPIFGRLGVEYLTDNMIFDYAKRLGFGVDLSQDLPVSASRLNMTLADDWQKAEAASGFTKDILMGPLHAAAMAAAVSNGGTLYRPYLVKSITDRSDREIFKGGVSVLGRSFSESTAKSLKAMMRETTRIGSGRKSFSSHKRYRSYRGSDFGGKTGSLSGYDPDGKYGWFAGFGEKDGRKIAYASLVVYKEKWVVRASRVAFEVLNHFFNRK